MTVLLDVQNVVKSFGALQAV
ncbi:MAG: hypothetical protein JWP07_1557, partial [Pseudonocardiales bacterium]|nr:hypothetical protein [Pseudonocardiales bacterium]